MDSVSSSGTICNDFDVVVCGGGPAGWVSAVASARLGARTALIERFGFLGGTATAGYVVPISGFYKNGELVVGGIPYLFAKDLESMGAAQFEMPKGNLSINTEYYKLLAQRMVLDAGVNLYTNSCVISAETEGSAVRSVKINSKNGVETVRAKYFVDATGDGDLCSYVGMPMWSRDDPQPISLCFVLSGVDCTTELLKNSIHHDGKDGSRSCNSEIRSFLTSVLDGSGTLFGGPWFNTLLCGDSVAVNVTRSNARVLNAREYSLAECQLREDMFKITQLLKERFPEFRNCQISVSACNAGVRESRHLQGAYILTGDDLLNSVSFADTIAMCSHPMDMHDPNSSAQELFDLNKAGSIPYRCLYARDFSNILAAGRIISANVPAYASIRVQATAMAIGQASGTAAALCANLGYSVESLPVEKLQETLLANGAIISNAE